MKTPRLFAASCVLLLAALPMAGTVHAAVPDAATEKGGSEIIEFGLKVTPELRAKMDKGRGEKRGNKNYTVKPRIKRYLNAAAEKYYEDQAAEGLELLNRLDMNRLNDNEQAQVHKLKGFMYFGTGEIAPAIESLENMLALEIMPVSDDDQMRSIIPRLHAMLAQWDMVVETLARWIAWDPEVDPEAYYLLAAAYWNLENFEAAKFWASKAVDAIPEPKETWLQLLAALYVREQNYDNAAPLFEELVMRFPKKDYWVQLSLIYGARDDYVNSLAVQQIAYQQGLLTEGKELERLARGYLYKNLPYPAAQVLAKGLDEGAIEPEAKVYEMLANAWIASREFEKAVEPLQMAAEIATDGALYIRLAQVHMQNEEWTDAAGLIEKALAKGGFNDKQLASANLLLGICLYNAENVIPARTAFRQARRHESMREQADAWIQHITKELQSQG